jgi:hypothetical protein
LFNNFAITNQSSHSTDDKAEAAIRALFDYLHKENPGRVYLALIGGPSKTAGITAGS